MFNPTELVPLAWLLHPIRLVDQVRRCPKLKTKRTPGRPRALQINSSSPEDNPKPKLAQAGDGHAERQKLSQAAKLPCDKITQRLAHTSHTWRPLWRPAHPHTHPPPPHHSPSHPPPPPPPAPQPTPELPAPARPPARPPPAPAFARPGSSGFCGGCASLTGTIRTTWIRPPNQHGSAQGTSRRELVLRSVHFHR